MTERVKIPVLKIIVLRLNILFYTCWRDSFIRDKAVCIWVKTMVKNGISFHRLLCHHPISIFLRF